MLIIEDWVVSGRDWVGWGLGGLGGGAGGWCFGVDVLVRTQVAVMDDR